MRQEAGVETEARNTAPGDSPLWLLCSHHWPIFSGLTPSLHKGLKPRNPVWCCSRFYHPEYLHRVLVLQEPIHQWQVSYLFQFIPSVHSGSQAAPTAPEKRHCGGFNIHTKSRPKNHGLETHPRETQAAYTLSGLSFDPAKRVRQPETEKLWTCNKDLFYPNSDFHQGGRLLGHRGNWQSHRGKEQKNQSFLFQLLQCCGRQCQGPRSVPQVPSTWTASFSMTFRRYRDSEATR